MERNMKNYWDAIYETKAEDEVSWYQPDVAASPVMKEIIALPLDAAIMDVGGGDSRFAEALLDMGYTNLHVIDISEAALQRAKDRLGERASMVEWTVSDVTAFVPPVRYDCWHDRAAFHFLTTEEKISSYVSLVGKAIKKDGLLVIGTFSEKGPLKCSGLEIKQYSEASMAERFTASFEHIQCFYEDHPTPFGSLQNFIFCTFRRK